MLLGVIYQHGQDVPKDPERAYRTHKDLADPGEGRRDGADWRYVLLRRAWREG